MGARFPLTAEKESSFAGGIIAPIVCATRLDTMHLDAVRRLLMRDVETNLFLLGLLDARGLSNRNREAWWGIPAPDNTSELDAVVFMGGFHRDAHRALAVPFGDPAACARIGAALADTEGCNRCIGPRHASDALWASLGQPRARLAYDQRLYICRRASSGVTLPIRQARTDEISWVSEASVQMMIEDLLEDPRETTPLVHARRISTSVHGGRTLVAEVDDELVFKLDVGTHFALGAQVGGTWVPPAYRRQGIATRAMRAACLRLLETVPMVSLHVNEKNTSAVRCYEAVGFVARTPMRLLAR